MKVLTKPLTLEGIKTLKDDNNFIEGIVPVSLGDVVDNDIEGFLDILSEKIIGRTTLMNINYFVAGYQDQDTILIRVSGDASNILKED